MCIGPRVGTVAHTASIGRIHIGPSGLSLAAACNPMHAPDVIALDSGRNCACHVSVCQCSWMCRQTCVRVGRRVRAQLRINSAKAGYLAQLSRDEVRHGHCTVLHCTALHVHCTLHTAQCALHALFITLHAHRACTLCSATALHMHMCIGATTTKVWTLRGAHCWHNFSEPLRARALAWAAATPQRTPAARAARS